MMKTSLRWAVTALVVASGMSVGTARADEGIHAGVDLLFLSPKSSSVGVNNVFNYSTTRILRLSQLMAPWMQTWNLPNG